MGPGSDRLARDPAGAPVWVVVLDVGAKALLVLALSRVALDPAWGNLEGKSPGTRALTYPLLAFLVPLAHLLRRPGRPYPWLADLMITVPAFSDILGNRLDLFDQLLWFDDACTSSTPVCWVARRWCSSAPPERRWCSGW